MSKPKHYFAPVPNRAGSDGRLRRIHLRVLLAIAAHDRFGQNGKGCTLSTGRIGENLKCKQTDVAKAIRELKAWGYLSAEPNPDHKQKNMHRVTYDDDADWNAFFGKDLEAVKAGFCPATQRRARPGLVPNQEAMQATEETSLKETNQIPSKRTEKIPLKRASRSKSFRPRRCAGDRAHHPEPEKFPVDDEVTKEIWGPLSSNCRTGVLSK